LNYFAHQHKAASIKIEANLAKQREMVAMALKFSDQSTDPLTDADGSDCTS